MLLTVFLAVLSRGTIRDAPGKGMLPAGVESYCVGYSIYTHEYTYKTCANTHRHIYTPTDIYIHTV